MLKKTRKNDPIKRAVFSKKRKNGENAHMKGRHHRFNKIRN